MGFLIGHLDGTANSLGVYGGNELNTAANTNNAKIMVHGRQVMSYSSLIGRTLNDNVYDDANANFDRKYFDFDKIIRANIAGGVSGEHTPFLIRVVIYQLIIHPSLIMLLFKLPTIMA